mmetsp:Transcript_63548/g.119330  ORF Transcript_63548/g.119330 Transcript_63548/m.119330 type:complete len:122 (-) Transcript_63548:963-1328(-)
MAVGADVGRREGIGVGAKVGSGVGAEVGEGVGGKVGSGVGWKVGRGEGESVGAGVGVLVGAGVIVGRKVGEFLKTPSAKQKESSFPTFSDPVLEMRGVAKSVKSQEAPKFAAATDMVAPKV